MRAVIYARYSSDKQRDASIEDQVRNCERYAEQHGLEIVERFADRAISGTKSDRPGYRRLLSGAEERAFDVLLVDDLSRLTRDEVELKHQLRQFSFEGLRVIGVCDGFDTASKGHKVQAGVRGLINEIYLDDLRDKTHRGLMGQALKGNNTGGRTYGYRHVPVEDPTRTDEFGRPVVVAVRREIDEEQAPWVRQIFEWFADGWSTRRIAAELNRRSVPSPRSGTWAQTAIYGDMTKGTGLLNNELYVGRYVWNRSMWVRDPNTGHRRRRLRPQQDWVVNQLPELRIISDELWEKAKARQREQRRRSEAVRRALHPNARTGAGPKYLLSGLLACGCCGANYIIANGSGYACSSLTNRGEAVCPNRLRVGRRLAESRLLDGIKHDLFTEEALALFEKETLRLLKRKLADRGAEERRLRQERAKLDKQIKNLLDTLKAGITNISVKAELDRLELEQAVIERDLAVLDRRRPVGPLLPDAAERFQRLIENLDSVLERDVPRARTILRGLLGEKIKLVPQPEGYLVAELRGDYRGLVALLDEQRPGARGTGASSEINLVAGGGFEPPTFRL